MSSASPPRTSPTTMRSGRIRSAVRTRSRTVTAPAPSAFGGRGLEPHDVRLREPELGGLLDGDDALARRSIARGERVQQRRLARRSCRRTRRCSTRPRTAHAQERRPTCASSPNAPSGTARAPKRRMVRHGPSMRERRDHGVEPRAVGETARRPSATTGRAAGPSGATTRSTRRRMPRLVETERDRLEAAGALDERAPRAVHHHLGDLGVGEQRLERTEPDDLVGRARATSRSCRAVRAAAPRRAAARRAGGAAPRARRLGRRARRADGDRSSRGVDASLRAAPPRRLLSRSLTAPARSGRGARRGPAARAAGRARASGRRAGEHTGVDRARDRRTHGNAGEHGPVEHVRDLARRRAIAPAPRRARHPQLARAAGCAPRGAARGSSRAGRPRTGRRPPRPHDLRALAAASTSTIVGTGPSRSATASAAPASAAGAARGPVGRAARGSSATPGAASIASRSSASVGRSGPRGEPVGSPVGGSAASAEDRRLVAAEIGEARAIGLAREHECARRGEDGCTGATLR